MTAVRHVYIKSEPVSRQMRTIVRRASKESWKNTGRHFHVNHRDLRFTVAHARRAKYTRRSGEGMSVHAPTFRRTYTGRKLRQKGHMKPLVWSGESRRLARSASISSTSKGVKIKYPGLRKFNLRHPKSQIRMNEEFRRIADYEVPTFQRVFKKDLADQVRK